MNVKRWVYRCVAGLLLATLTAAAGCNFFKTDQTRFLSPDKVVRQPGRSPINPIRTELSLADQSEELYPNSTFPEEEDYLYSDEDYVIGPTDVVRVSIMDIVQEGLESVYERQISEAGYLSLPLLPERIKASGRTKDGEPRMVRQPDGTVKEVKSLKDAIVEAYEKSNILRDARVSVQLMTRRQSVFSILGAVRNPSSYNIMRRDMRLLEALALAGGIVQSPIPYIYVIRQEPAVPRSEAGRKPVRTTGPTAGPELGPLPKVEEPATTPAGSPSTPTPAPTPPANGQKTPPAKTDTAPKTGLEALEGELQDANEPGGTPGLPDAPRLSDMSPTAARTPSTARTTAPAVVPVTLPGEDIEPVESTSGRSYKWIYSNGEWIRVAQDAPTAVDPSGKGTGEVRPIGQPPATMQAEAPSSTDPFGWSQINRSGMARIIAVNLDKLRRGDPRMNIVVRDNDVVYVPPLETGEFYMMGEVQRPGVYSLTGRRITVKMALAAAGNLGSLAWPENSILVRRIGQKQEQIIPINIEAIVRGDAPDIFLKPNDVIAVGTDARAIFFAVLRNAFRMTYGFGFIYDRNFADPPLFGATSKRFTRW